MIHKNTLNYIEEILKSSVAEDLRIFSFEPLSGGDINEAYKLESSHGPYFIKLNHALKFPGMFKFEAQGLELLSQSNSLRIPKVILNDGFQEQSFLILEFIDTVSQKDFFWDDFAKGLATLHKCTNDSFGLDHDNYIGSLKQFNNQKPDWINFFIEERLIRQIKLARDSQLINQEVLSSFERFFNLLNELVPEEVPSLLHGDLWSGNFMVDNVGNPCVIDPAVYYGHREMDLAMTKLFGGFSPEFYEAYHQYFPLEKGWESRMDICNLYPLLVHLNLFGGSYLGQITSIIRKF